MNINRIIIEEIQKLIKPYKGILYHGSNWEFDSFDLKWVGRNSDPGHYSQGIYFTPNEDLARYYGEYIYVCEVILSNPFYVMVENKRQFLNIVGIGDVSPEEVTKHLISMGYDGVILLDVHNENEIQECVVYDTKNILILNKK